MIWGSFNWGSFLWGTADVVGISGSASVSVNTSCELEYIKTNISGNASVSVNTSCELGYAISIISGSANIIVNTTAKLLKSIGTLTDAKTYSFFFNNKVYFQNGHEYKSYDGTSLIDVEGYVPKVAVATPYGGGGTPYEEINTLTGKKHQTFNGDNSHTTFQLAETSIDSVDKVLVNGVEKTLTTHYTVNTTNGTITFVTAPPTGLDNVDIFWTKGTGTRTNVTANKQSTIWGGANDTRIFAYGVSNKVIFSGLAAGLSSAEYFPENNFINVGSNQYSVTNLAKQYDRLIINKEVGSYYSVSDFDVTNGINFPTYPLNDKIGNIAFGQGQTVLNNPFTLTQNGIYRFIATNVRDERNAEFMSQRVANGLSFLDLSQAITFDFESMYEYWMFVGNKGYIYNYKVDVWYYFELGETPTSFILINKDLYIGTSNGKIHKFANNLLSDNDVTIESRWETGFLSFDANYINKFCNFVWVGLQPQARSLCNIEWETDKGDSQDPYNINYNLFSYGNVVYSDFSYATNDSPQPFRLKFKAKKFCYMKIIGSNDSKLDGMTILNITVPVVYGGMSK